MTILTVAAVLGGISLLLWLSAFIESRQLGPLVVDATDPVPALSVVETVQTAA